MQKSANFFIKKLCFPRFNKLYVLINFFIKKLCFPRFNKLYVLISLAFEQ